MNIIEQLPRSETETTLGYPQHGDYLVCRSKWEQHQPKTEVSHSYFNDYEKALNAYYTLVEHSIQDNLLFVASISLCLPDGLELIDLFVHAER